MQMSINHFPKYTNVIVTPKKGNTWKGQVVGRSEGSVSKLVVEDTDRGPGYDEMMNRYVGVKTKSGWYLGKNNDFGTQHIIHKNNLTPA